MRGLPLRSLERQQRCAIARLNHIKSANLCTALEDLHTLYLNRLTRKQEDLDSEISREFNHTERAVLIYSPGA